MSTKEKQNHQKAPTQTTITAYKGFDSDWKCRGFQYEVGKTYEHSGEIKACESGFHACENPLDVFGYYPPAGSRFALVEQSGIIDKGQDGDSKIASQTIHIKAEIDMAYLVKAAIEFTKSKCLPIDPSSPASATGDRGAALATGIQGVALADAYQGAALATGIRGVALAVGDRGAALADRDRGVALATGIQGVALADAYQGAALATGIRGVALATGTHGVACGLGFRGKALAAKTGAIVLVHRNYEGEVVHILASKVGENGIKPDTWYTLDKEGQFVECEA